MILLCLEQCLLETSQIAIARKEEHDIITNSFTCSDYWSFHLAEGTNCYVLLSDFGCPILGSFSLKSKFNERMCPNTSVKNLY